MVDLKQTVFQAWLT